MLRTFYKDLYDTDLKHPNEVTVTVLQHMPELEVRRDVRRHLEFVANRFGVNPQPRLGAGVRSFIRASRAVCSSARLRRVLDGSRTRLGSSAAPIAASTRASTASVLAACPMARAKSRARFALTPAGGNAGAKDSSNVRHHGPVDDISRRRADPLG